MLNIFCGIRQKNNISEGSNWFYGILSDIDSESKKVSGNTTGEKEELAIELDRDELEISHFGETLYQFTKRKKEMYE